MSGGYDSRNRGSYTATYRFICDPEDGYMGPRTVANGCLEGTLPSTDSDGLDNDYLPNFGAAYDYETELGTGEAESTSYAQDYRVRFNANNRYVGTIDVVFSPLADGETLRDRAAYSGQVTPPDLGDIGGDPYGDDGTATGPTNSIAPEDRGVSWYWDEEAYTAIVDKDKDGDPIVNAAGRSYDRPPTMEKTRGVLVAEFKVRTLREVITLNRTYAGAVNSVAWTLFSGTGFTNPPARSVVCRYARSGRAAYEGSWGFYPMQMGFAFANDGETWDLELLNEGFGYLSGSTYIDTDSEGAKFVEPFLLDTDGTKLGEGVTGNFLSYRVRPEVDFNNLDTYFDPS